MTPIAQKVAGHPHLLAPRNPDIWKATTVPIVIPEEKKNHSI